MSYGERVIPEVHRCIAYAEAQNWLVLVSRDWHPSNHCSFIEQGGPWPEHCVQGSEGAAFHPDFHFPDRAVVVNKATEADKEVYSAFSGAVDRTGQPVRDLLEEHDIEDIYVCGLALDYCVFKTAKEACLAGYRVHVILSACRGVNADLSSCKDCLQELIGMGVKILTTFP